MRIGPRKTKADEEGSVRRLLQSLIIKATEEIALDPGLAEEVGRSSWTLDQWKAQPKGLANGAIKVVRAREESCQSYSPNYLLR